LPICLIRCLRQHSLSYYLCVRMRKFYS
jgi:hypothetical protein